MKLKELIAQKVCMLNYEDLADGTRERVDEACAKVLTGAPVNVERPEDASAWYDFCSTASEPEKPHPIGIGLFRCPACGHGMGAELNTPPKFCCQCGNAQHQPTETVGKIIADASLDCICPLCPESKDKLKRRLSDLLLARLDEKSSCGTCVIKDSIRRVVRDIFGQKR